MNNAGMPENLPKVSAPLPIDDIPEALRDIPESVPPSSVKPILLITSLAVLGAIALTSIVIIALEPKPTVISTPASSTPVEKKIIPTGTGSDRLYLDINGKRHFAYQEAPAAELTVITADGRMRLRKTAAQEFKAMVAAARANGVILVPISAFRAIEEQQHLFFDVKMQRGQGASKRAEVSAPPGYSEHHTGYAADIGDGNVPVTNLNTNFENTRAFKWLQANAVKFNFEMSFPRNNPQGINYEPWHWRYVGDRFSLETFYKAKNSLN